MEKLNLEKFLNKQICLSNITGGIEQEGFFTEPCLNGTGYYGEPGDPFKNDKHQDYDCDGEINGNDSYYEETHPGTN